MTAIADAQEDIMTEWDREIAELSKELLGRIVQGAVTNGAAVDAQQCAALAVQCATALVDRLDALK
ncbi:hypothetical protein KDW88_03445 [Burkholderia cenocepacia]|uniref:hypothetical protein n=1 Tax=Burkholderia cenocepacia TaxID=95486 RepID=UPI000846FAB5|nr:hypothetical protein [Burkholderia cenocepacia]MBR8265815.1 hypothetical protein [Burkholderia cenocepacia]